AAKVKDKPKAEAVKPAAAKPAASAVDPETEAAALAFVREHYAELADLLDSLKDSRPREYQKAIKDLARVRERLQQMQKNNVRRYELEVTIWKTESRIQLLAARLQMNNSSELRDQLRAALNEQADQKLAALKLERELFQERADKLNAQIKKFDQGRSQAIERQFEALTKSPAVTSKPEPTDKPKTAKPEKKPAKPAAAVNSK
ncbi:MAG TPA: hypothetical protein VL096_15090, partial [Pirellulaceae bacterium]|nr:hypothetical protein [Pirellulaceae bacterium]